jgi:hypothetical protein
VRLREWHTLLMNSRDLSELIQSVLHASGGTPARRGR